MNDNVDSAVRPTPDYKLSFGGRFSIELEWAGYKREGTCQMDNGLTGVVYCRRPNSEISGPSAESDG